VHVKDQRRGVVGMDQPCQDDTRQKGLARAGGSKNARRALHELIQVEHHRVPLFAGAADTKQLLAILLAEDLGDITR
jgi:hypothetical protein